MGERLVREKAAPADFWCQHAPSAEHHWTKKQERVLMGRWIEQSLQETLVVACEEAWLECEKRGPSASGMRQDRVVERTSRQ